MVTGNYIGNDEGSLSSGPPSRLPPMASYNVTLRHTSRALLKPNKSFAFMSQYAHNKL